jgi:hypothetical protein
MLIEHLDCLSWFSEMAERHEQDGETLSRAVKPQARKASGDPAMTPVPPLRRDGARCAGSISAAASLPEEGRNNTPVHAQMRAGKRPRDLDQRRIPSLSISVL